MSSKVQLLKLCRTVLIKLCKKHNVSSNGTKSDMIDRLLKSKSFDNKDISSLAPKSSRKIKKRSQNHVQIKKSTTNISNACFYNFKSYTNKNKKINHKHFKTIAEINEIFNLFTDYLSIYTMCNFISAFPKYQIYYKQSKTINEAMKNIENTDFKVGGEYLLLLRSGDLYFSKYNLKSSKQILDRMIKRYNNSECNISRGRYVYGKKYKESSSDQKDILQFNKTVIYNINHLLHLIVGVRSRDKMDLDKKKQKAQLQSKSPSDLVITFVEKYLKKKLDVISWNDVLNYKEIIDDEEKRNKFEGIYIVYLFLELILGLNGKDGQIVYSAVWGTCHDEWEETRNDCYWVGEQSSGYLFMFEGINIGDNVCEVFYDVDGEYWYELESEVRVLKGESRYGHLPDYMFDDY
eukprot:45558_1